MTSATRESRSSRRPTDRALCGHERSSFDAARRCGTYNIDRGHFPAEEVPVTGPDDHNKIIAAAARESLTPLGMVRKGRSRIWLADRGWWLGIVEFQCSSWSRGTYLNVSLMWLWQPIDHFAIEVEPRRVGKFVEFDNTPDVEGAVKAVTA